MSNSKIKFWRELDDGTEVQIEVEYDYSRPDPDTGVFNAEVEFYPPPGIMLTVAEIDQLTVDVCEIEAERNWERRMGANA